jgi:tetratricopeptide (TPR) repeat protein
VLPRLVSLGRDEPAPTGRWVAEASLDDDDERALVQVLVEARLLVADHLRGRPGYRVAHEALLRRWPRVTAWVTRHRATLAVRDEMLPWVQRWAGNARPNALLLPGGTLLYQARAAVAAVPGLFGEEERAFVRSSSTRLRRQANVRWMAGACMAALALVAALAAWRSAQLARTASEHALQSQRLASFMLGELAGKLRPIGRLDLLSRIGEQAWQVLSPASSHDESPVDVMQRAKALIVIGETNSSRGQGRTDIAIKALDDATRMLGPLEHAPGVTPAEYYATLGASAFWRGQIAFDAGDLDSAASEMLHYRDACERWLAAAPADANGRAEMGFALNSLGSVAVQRAAWADAQRWFQASLALKQALLAAHPDDAQAQDAVASSRIWLGLVARIRGEPGHALALLDEAVATQRRLLAQHPAELERVADLGATLMRRAEALRDLDRLDDAALAMDAAAARLDSAAHGDPENRHWAEERAHVQVARQLARAEAYGVIPQVAAAAAPPAASGPPSLKLEITRILQPAIDAELARRRADWPAVLAFARDGARRVDTQLAERPLQWQLTELRARFGALQLAAAAILGPEERMALCRRVAAGLEPAVRHGQAGIVATTWRSASSCAAAGEPDAAFREKTPGSRTP